MVEMHTCGSKRHGFKPWSAIHLLTVIFLHSSYIVVMEKVSQLGTVSPFPWNDRTQCPMHLVSNSGDYGSGFTEVNGDFGIGPGF